MMSLYNHFMNSPVKVVRARLGLPSDHLACNKVIDTVTSGVVVGDQAAAQEEASRSSTAVRKLSHSAHLIL